METTEKLSDNIFGALTRSEVAEKLAPAIRLHGIEVQNDCFVFPGISPTVGISESQLPGPDAPGVIRFEDIASITPFSARIEVLLFSGELYTFSTVCYRCPLCNTKCLEIAVCDTECDT